MFIALLSLVAVIFFFAVTALAHVYRAQQQTLADRWYSRGLNDLQQRHFDRAIVDFRTALLYSRDNYNYRLNMAEALLGLKRTDEASTYLRNLWEREPENGLVNLELARIAVQAGDTDQALRYYHNAIYATWPSDQEVRRRDVRLELINFLLNIRAGTQAQSELIGLAANLGDDPSQHTRVADLFMRADDYDHALSEYRAALKSESGNSSALAGAGEAAFRLRQYNLAERYLQQAVSANPGDSNSAEQLKIAQLIGRMDPFRRQLSDAQRDRAATEAFRTAGRRLEACSLADSSLRAQLDDLRREWAAIKSHLGSTGSRRNGSLLEPTMNLVFRIERQTNVCGPQTDADQALKLIAQLHEGSESGTATQPSN